MAASYLITMLGAIATVHWPLGFFMNWFGQQQGEGFEFHLRVMAISVILIGIGGGKWSVDGLIARLLAEREITQHHTMRKVA